MKNNDETQNDGITECLAPKQRLRKILSHELRKVENELPLGLQKELSMECIAGIQELVLD